MQIGIKIGDRFRRTDQTCQAGAYSVTAIFEPQGQQLHARLVKDRSPSETITISVPTLRDRRFWERLDA